MSDRTGSAGVAHTHGHLDHVAGDGQFADRPATTIVDRELSAVQAFFGFTSWPDQIVHFDLGGRVVELTGTPGHHRAALTIYDPWSGFLLTGDNVLPGRIYAFDFLAYVDSMERTVEFASRRQITHVMGCHIEMTRRPGRDYPAGCTYQPDEPPLQMTVQQLIAIRDAARSIKEQPGAHPFDDFLIMNVAVPPLHRQALGASALGQNPAAGKLTLLPHKQSHVEFALQLPNCARQRRLRHVQTLGPQLRSYPPRGY